MHPSRRRKKRPNYGLRTVEVSRGQNGFGFTISGQQPCILSCIVANSPADHAGLRAGDFLISVNGTSVSKITHDAVVNLIGNSTGPIKMTIAENYYSDSSDEEINMGRAFNSRKPKYPHKPRMHRGYKSEGYKRATKCSKESAYSFENYEENACGLNVSNPMEDEGGPIEYKAIVGYLGTIEMPKQLLPNSRFQTVCGCIKKLRQEKRKPTAVLMTVLPTCLTLKNASNHILAIYPTNRVVYISSSMDKDSRYFGLVTSAVCDRSLENVAKKCETSYTNVWDQEKKCNNAEKCELDVSNSCHVFVTDPKIIDHNVHAKKAESFRINCTKDVVTGYCLEFPRNAFYIVSLVQNMYRLQSTLEPHRVVEDLVANSPQPSASSNSDSGIGFRDDCGNVSDRILVVEFPGNRQLPVLPNNNNRPINIIASNIQLESLDLPMNNDNNLNNVRAKAPNVNNIRACENISIKNAIDRIGVDYLTKQNNEADVSKLNCRAFLPDEQATYSERPIDVPESISQSACEDFKSSIDNISMHSSKSLDLNTNRVIFKKPCLNVKKRNKRAHNFVSSCENLIGGDKYEASLMNYKLSPKVYGLSKPNHSCEELSNIECNSKCGGSLQDLTLWNADRKRIIAQSEPDVRIERSAKDLNMCEDNGMVKTCNEGPAAWASSFEKLLECPGGLHTFAEFLKKEFSAENIYFWTACERYKKITSHTERTAEANRIYQQHLRVGAPEAVNVDSQARQYVEQELKTVSVDLFDLAQKQILNLMKFDSYSRFLKSDLYKQCLAGNSRQHQLDPQLLLNPSAPKLKKSLSNAEDRRRKSLLPWHRKNRSKSKDRGENEFVYRKHDVNENVADVHHKSTDIHSSKSSLTSLDFALCSNTDVGKANNEQMSIGRNPLCRVRLMNGSTTITQLKETETILELVNRLLEKRGISYSAFEVYSNKHSKPVNVNEPSYSLAGCEVEVQQRVVFKIDLPNKKIISVKSKNHKILVDVLRPILEKHSYTLEKVSVTWNDEPVDVSLPVTAVDNARLNVQLLPEQNDNKFNKSSNMATLDDITNRVYEDILQEKYDNSTNKKSKSDLSSVKSEDWGSEQSSGLIGKFLKRDSERNRERKKKIAGRSKGNSNSSSTEDLSASQSQNSTTCKKPLIAKLKAGVKIQNTSESEELYEGLNRAQRSRLEDQRGTKINFAMPDFLKDETEQNKLKRFDGAGDTSARFYSGESVLPLKQESIAAISAAKNLKLELHSNYENRMILNDLNSSRVNNLSVYSSSTSSSNSSPSKLVDLTVIDNSKSIIDSKTEPPPLPPKPKILPMKPSNWKQRDNFRKVCSKELYLEQPTSSFV